MRSPCHLARTMRRRNLTRRRASVVMFVAVGMAFIIGFTALALDLSKLYTGSNELQRAADAAALGAAQDLMLPLDQDPHAAVVQAANDLALRNPVLGIATGLDADQDVQFGEVVENAAGVLSFSPVASVLQANAVRVTLRRTEGSPGGPIEFSFAQSFGQTHGDLSATATAMVVPRDIAVVVDLSGSMNDDSEMRHAAPYMGLGGQQQNGIAVNLRDVWAALDGPAPPYPYTVGAYDSDTGPTIGAMAVWGYAIVANAVPTSSDPGLWYIPQGAPCTETAVADSLAARGYTQRQINRIMSATSRRTEWRNRVAVILGLAQWSPHGPRDSTVSSSELTWIGYPPFRVNWTWTNYIDWAASGYSAMARALPQMRYRYGLKTFVNFLLENRARFSQTILHNTPEQPVQAVKDAVQVLVETVGEVDQISLEIFAQTAHHEVSLTKNRQTIADRLYEMQAAHYDSRTNIGGGLSLAIDQLTGPNARPGARKVIVMLSDGVPNINEGGSATSDGSASAVGFAIDQAQRAAQEGIRIYTVSVGENLSRELMIQMASLGAGQEFHASGTPDQYTQELREIFRTIGGKREVALVE